MPLIGRYQLLDRIAQGGMAELYRARVVGEEGFSKVLAIKRILPKLARDQQFVQMLIDEARLASNLSHPNIVQVLELGRDELGYFIAMEFVCGPNLAGVLNALLERGERLPEACAIDVVLQVLHALDYAHRMRDARGQAMQLVHRDVSPENVLVTTEGIAKLSDFGVAKARGRLTETRVGGLKGKPAYMAPEQLLGKPIDGRCDLFAAALVLWECLAGRLRYDARQQFELMKQVAAASPLSLAQVGVKAAPELEAALARALAREPEDRYLSALEFADDLMLFHRRAHPTYTPAVLGDLVARLFAPQMKALSDRLRGFETGQAKPMGWAGAGTDDSSSASRGFSPMQTRVAPTDEATAAQDLKRTKAASQETRAQPRGALGRREPSADEQRQPTAGPESGAAAVLRVAQETAPSSLAPDDPEAPPATSPEQRRAIEEALAADAPRADPPKAGGRRKGVSPLALLLAFAIAALGVLFAAKALEGDPPVQPPAPPESRARPLEGSAAAGPAHASSAPTAAKVQPLPAPAAPSGTGTLDLDCRPEPCRVDVDGKTVGFTPLKALTVAAGRRRVRVVNRAVNLEKTIVLDVEPGSATIRTVNLVLEH